MTGSEFKNSLASRQALYLFKIITKFINLVLIVLVILNFFILTNQPKLVHAAMSTGQDIPNTSTATALKPEPTRFSVWASNIQQALQAINTDLLNSYQQHQQAIIVAFNTTVSTITNTQLLKHCNAFWINKTSTLNSAANTRREIFSAASIGLVNSIIEQQAKLIPKIQTTLKFRVFAIQPNPRLIVLHNQHSLLLAGLLYK